MTALTILAALAYGAIALVVAANCLLEGGRTSPLRTLGILLFGLLWPAILLSLLVFTLLHRRRSARVDN